MKHAVNSDLAEADLADIWVEIATSDIDIADQIIEGLRTLAQKLAEQPLMGRERPEFGIDIARVIQGARDLTTVEVFKPGA